MLTGLSGYHHDDESKHAERLRFWQQLNLCWEAIGQKQRTITEEAIRIQRQPQDALTAEGIKQLVENLIGLCDSLEQYGLVDYEMGLWEEQITHVFGVCLDLLDAEAAIGQTQPVENPPGSSIPG